MDDILDIAARVGILLAGLVAFAVIAHVHAKQQQRRKGR